VLPCRWLRKSRRAPGSHCLVATSSTFRPAVDQHASAHRPWFRSRLWGTPRARHRTTRIPTGRHQPHRSVLPSRRRDRLTSPSRLAWAQAGGAAGGLVRRLFTRWTASPLRDYCSVSVVLVVERARAPSLMFPLPTGRPRLGTISTHRFNSDDHLGASARQFAARAIGIARAMKIVPCLLGNSTAASRAAIGTRLQDRLERRRPGLLRLKHG